MYTTCRCRIIYWRGRGRDQHSEGGKTITTSIRRNAVLFDPGNPFPGFEFMVTPVIRILNLSSSTGVSYNDLGIKHCNFGNTGAQIIIGMFKNSLSGDLPHFHCRMGNS